MARLAAFVGHSFTKNDEEVVQRFLEFLDRVQELDIGFTWDHAEYAEPKVLSEKVKAKMQDKNLFIGICTAKENAIGPEKIRAHWFRKTQVQAERQDFEVKTSDWITQEIGYALGREMQILLLLEQGVRRPGGLQGDLEYIPFVRTSSSEAFPKILEMIRSMTPRAATQTGPAATTPPESEEKKSRVQQQADAEDLSPRTQDEFERALISACIAKDEGKIAALHKLFAKTPNGAMELERDHLEMFGLSVRTVIDQAGDLDRMRKLAEKHPHDRRFATFLARAYGDYGQNDKAAELHLRAVDLGSTADEKSDSVTDAAVARAKAGDLKADAWLRDLHQGLKGISEVAHRNLLWALAKVAEQREHWDRWFAYQEARIVLKPGDNDLRFELAHKYSERGYNALALYHYLKIPSGSRSDSAWNNIGVAAQQLQLPAFSVEAYRRSKAEGGTLAVSNLAYKFIAAGFLDEAEVTCKEAMKSPYYDRRVAAAVGSIDEIKKTEGESRKTLLEGAEKQRRFLADLGTAMTVADVAPSGSVWKNSECDAIAVKIEAGRFEAEGKFERASLAGLYAFMHGTTKATTYVVNYGGQIVGRGCVVTKKSYEEGKEPKSILAEGVAGETAYLIVDEKMGGIREMRGTDKAQVSFEEWTRVA
jgi:thioredoxin-like negative regulator of GroEL